VEILAKLVYGMNQSLDGYVDHLELRPSPALRLRGFEFFLSSFPHVGRDDTLPVEGSAPTI
jgi:hypothetical protein